MDELGYVYIRNASAGLRFFPLAMAVEEGARGCESKNESAIHRLHNRDGPTQARPLPIISVAAVVFLSFLSPREGRNPTIAMAAPQNITRPSNPPTPKRVAKSASTQSLNHLLNFSLPPRQTQQVQSLPRRSRRHGTTQGVWNKERELLYHYISAEVLYYGVLTIRSAS